MKNISTRKKLIVIALFAILLPLFILTYFQFSSLVELENKTKAAYKENLRQNSINVIKQVEARFEKYFNQILLPVGNIKLSATNVSEQLEKYFANIKKTHPEIGKIYIFSGCGCENEKDGIAYVYSNGLTIIENSELNKDKEITHLRNLFKNAMMSQSYLDDNHNFLALQHTCERCLTDNKPTNTTYVFYPLPRAATQNHMTFASVSLDNDTVKTKFLNEIMGETINNLNPGNLNPEVVINVTDEGRNQIFSTAPGRQEYLDKMTFSRPFSNWKMGIGFKDTNIESLARYGFWKNLLITFLILAFLILGISLTLRATNREVGLAHAKSSFVSNVSHELKTPLSLIRLFIEMLENDYVTNDEKKREYYRVIGDESRRLTHLINNILDFSKIESGHRKYIYKYEQIDEVIKNVISNYRHQIDLAGFELQLSISSADIPPVLIDRDAIAQAIINLLDNAIKYSTETKKISIGVKKDMDSLTIEVADCGIGIEKADHKKIFEKFFRVSDGLVHDVKGSGLGLSLVKHIIDAHKGKISVESKFGEGSRFIIRIPFITEKEINPSSSAFAQGGFEIAESADS